MEVLYEIRDAFFWWAGVWATITLANHGVKHLFRKRRLKYGALAFTEFQAARLSDEEQDEEPATDTDTHGQTDKCPATDL